jgi:hypothetical protein
MWMQASTVDHTAYHRTEGAIGPFKFSILGCGIRTSWFKVIPYGEINVPKLIRTPKLSTLIHVKIARAGLETIQGQKALNDDNWRRLGGLTKYPCMAFLGTYNDEV